MEHEVVEVEEVMVVEIEEAMVEEGEEEAKRAEAVVETAAPAGR